MFYGYRTLHQHELIFGQYKQRTLVTELLMVYMNFYVFGR
jgi:hypothetical protein